MRFHLTAMVRPLRVAKSLRHELAFRGVDIRPDDARAVTARLFGYENWQALERSIRPDPGSASPLDSMVGEEERERRRAHFERVIAQAFPALEDEAGHIVTAINPTGPMAEAVTVKQGVTRPGFVDLPDYVRTPPGRLDRQDAERLAAYDRDGSQEPGALLELLLAAEARIERDEAEATAPGPGLLLLHEAARRGSAAAMNRLGGWWFAKDNIYRDERTARFWLQRAVDILEELPQGQPHDLRDDQVPVLRRMARVNLGIAYQHAEELSPDLSKALALYRAAAEEGEPVAKLNLALMYLYGWGVDADYMEAAPYLQQAAEAGVPRAVELATFFARNAELGVEHLRMAWLNLVGGSEAWARREVFRELADPSSPFHDLEEAIALALRCLPEDMPDVADDAAEILLAMDEDAARAAGLEITQALAGGGSLSAMVRMATIYLKDDLLPQSVDQAVAILRHVTALIPEELPPEHRRHLARAFGLMGALLSGEEGVPRDPQGALNAYLNALALGDAGAGFNLGLALERGLFGSPDVDAAAVVYKQAVALGDNRARANLGLLHLKQRLRDSDPAYGLKLLHEGAESGDEVARAILDALESAAKPDEA